MALNVEVHRSVREAHRLLQIRKECLNMTFTAAYLPCLFNLAINVNSLTVLIQSKGEGRQMKLSLCYMLRNLFRLRNNKSSSGALEYQISHHVSYIESLLNIFS